MPLPSSKRPPFDFNTASADEVRAEAVHRTRERGRAAVLATSPMLPVASHQRIEAPSKAVKPKKPRRSKQMNKTEARYAAILAARKAGAWAVDGVVLDYQFEAITLRLADGVRWTPDFAVWMTDGISTQWVEFHEVKGAYEREDARIKRKVAAQQYAYFAFKFCQWKGGEWHISEIEGTPK